MKYKVWNFAAGNKVGIYNGSKVDIYLGNKVGIYTKDCDVIRQSVKMQQAN